MFFVAYNANCQTVEVEKDKSEVFVVSNFSAGSQIKFIAKDAEIEWQQELTGKIALVYHQIGEYSLVAQEISENNCNGKPVEIRINVVEKLTPKPEPEPQPEPEPEPEPQPEPEPEPNPEPEIEPTPHPEPIPEKEEFSLYVPNIFTPDNDGLNDKFYVKYNYRPQFWQITIFNRNGNEVFSSSNPDFYWLGKDSAPGVYYYIIKYTYNNINETLSGTITLAKNK